MVYRKRKALEINRDLLLLNLTAKEGIDIASTTKKMFEEFLPEDQKEKIIRGAIEEKEVRFEASKAIKVEKNKDGTLKLRIHGR